MNSNFSRKLKMLGMFLFLLGLITGFATAMDLWEHLCRKISLMQDLSL